MRTYRYIGGREGVPPEEEAPARFQIQSADDVAAFMREHAAEADLEGCVPGIFVVDPQKQLWLCDRYSEHVQCARGGEVLAAGELFLGGDPPEVVHITNQSTGYGPEPASWKAVEAALEKAGIAHPGGYDTALEFRRCRQCWEVAIVKDGDFTCLMCGADLPEKWNLDEEPPPEEEEKGK